MKTYHDRNHEKTSRKSQLLKLDSQYSTDTQKVRAGSGAKQLEFSGPNTYQVERVDGGKYRRNRVHLIRPTKVVRTPRDISPIVLTRTPEQLLTPAVPTTVPQTLTTGTEAEERTLFA